MAAGAGAKTVAAQRCARCSQEGEGPVCRECLRYLWVHEPLRFDVRVAPGPGVEAELRSDGVAVLSSDPAEPLEFRDAAPPRGAGAASASALRHLPDEGGSLLLAAGDLDPVHRALLWNARHAPSSREIEALKRLRGHVATIPGLPETVAAAFRASPKRARGKESPTKHPRAPTRRSSRDSEKHLSTRILAEVYRQLGTNGAKNGGPPETSSSPQSIPDEPRTPIAQAPVIRIPPKEVPEPEEMESGTPGPAGPEPPPSMGQSEPPAAAPDVVSRLEEGDLEGALQEYDGRLGANPRDAVAWFEKAEVLAMMDRPEDALDAYSHCLEIDPANARALAEKAGLLMSLGNFEEGLITLRTLIERNPAHVEEFLTRAEDLRHKGEPREAVLLCNVVLDVDPDHARALVFLGQALLDIGDLEAADRAFTRAATSHPGDPVALYHKGQMLLKQGRWGGAVQFFNRAVAQDWNFADAWVAKAGVLVRLAKAEEALETIEKVLRFAAHRADAWLLKAQAHIHLAQLDTALECYRKVLELDPKNEIAHLGRETLGREIEEKRKREAAAAQ